MGSVTKTRAVLEAELAAEREEHAATRRELAAARTAAAALLADKFLALRDPGVR